MDLDDSDRRLKYYGLRDYATYFQAERVKELLGGLAGPEPAERSLVDVIELYNLRLFLEGALFADEAKDATGKTVRELTSHLKGIVARYFHGLDENNLASSIGTDVGWQYQSDLLSLLGQNRVYERCSAQVVFDVLESARIGLAGLLGEKSLVRAYGLEIKQKLMSDPENAEHIIRKHFEDGIERDIFLPSELTNDDARTLLTEYVALDSANPNFLGLIATAQITTNGIVDARLKVRAQQAKERRTEALFSQSGGGIRSAIEVSIVDGQAEPFVGDRDDFTLKYSYSREWLDDSLDNASVLNNFIYVFGFVDEMMLLTMPAKQGNPGLVDRLTSRGVKDYPSNTIFKMNENITLLQMASYEQYLRDKDVFIEDVIQWAFEEYLATEYEARDFHFAPSDRGATYLQRCRHLLAEMESVAKQYSLYVDNGVLELDILAVAPDIVRYKELPSLLEGKYVYLTDDPVAQGVVNLLFSDQAGLGYIDENLRGNTGSELLIENEVKYEQFHDYQQQQIDHLINLGVLVDRGDRVWFANEDEFLVLRDLFRREAANYYQYRTERRAAVDSLEQRGWVRRESMLLTTPEGLYFNYVLNVVDFWDGPNLRNRYLHGTQANATAEAEHYQSYLIIMKMIIALTIKINDDLWLSREPKEDPSQDAKP